LDAVTGCQEKTGNKKVKKIAAGKELAANMIDFA